MMADGKEVVLEQGQNLNILLNERVWVATSSQGSCMKSIWKRGGDRRV